MYPITSERALKFWSSRNICNHVRAICAHSKDRMDANKNLRRFGYTRAFRDRVLNANGIVFNKPDMEGVPYNPGNVPTWECLSIAPSTRCEWDDTVRWGDGEGWTEC